VFFVRCYLDWAQLSCNLKDFQLAERQKKSGPKRELKEYSSCFVEMDPLLMERGTSCAIGMLVPKRGLLLWMFIDTLSSH
jgi:hypothetical protein